MSGVEREQQSSAEFLDDQFNYEAYDCMYENLPPQPVYHDYFSSQLIHVATYNPGKRDRFARKQLRLTYEHALQGFVSQGYEPPSTLRRQLARRFETPGQTEVATTTMDLSVSTFGVRLFEPERIFNPSIPVSRVFFDGDSETLDVLSHRLTGKHLASASFQDKAGRFIPYNPTLFSTTAVTYGDILNSYKYFEVKHVTPWCTWIEQSGYQTTCSVISLASTSDDQGHNLITIKLVLPSNRCTNHMNLIRCGTIPLTGLISRCKIVFEWSSGRKLKKNQMIALVKEVFERSRSAEDQPSKQKRIKRKKCSRPNHARIYNTVH